MNYIEEKIIKPVNGFIMLTLFILMLLASLLLLIAISILFDLDIIYSGGFALGITIACIMMTIAFIGFAGLKVVNPNEALVLSVFGRYSGTIYQSGFYFVNPFSSAVYPKIRDQETQDKSLSSSRAKLSSGSTKLQPNRKVSTKISTFVNGNQKVNDALGNPVDVSAIVVWKVVNATKAVINVDNYLEYLSNQTDSTIRNVARLYPYDVVSDDANESDDETTLRGSASQVAFEMKEELQRKVADAGIEIEDVKLNQIAYSPEIAAAMLQRQQAVAVIAARKKIVEGAVSMVQLALDRLKEDGVVELDEERKAQMVSNLMVVLCSSKETNPIINTGSIY